MDSASLKYPIGRFEAPGDFDPQTLRSFISDIEHFPTKLVNNVGPLTPEQQSWPYRPDGWTIKQVVHHCADSHMNSFTRFKLALTEDNPMIKPYLESEWAKMLDYETPVVHSIKILEGLHYRWTALLKNMDAEDFEKTFFHPESKKMWSLYTTLALYSWHCNHHLAHIQQAVMFAGQV